MGLSHITLIVRDLERTAAMLKSVLQAREIYSSGDQTFSLSKEKFFLIDDLWLCLMAGDALNERSYNHIAFQIQEEDYANCLAAIEKAGLELRPARPRVEGEGRSIYFFDYDNHLLELHTGTLEQRLASYEALNDSPNDHEKKFSSNSY